MAYGYADNIFTAAIDTDGTIYEASTGRKRQAIGIDTQKEQEYIAQITEMQEIIDNYYNKLIELGAIVPPKTPEEIALETAAQQATINQKLLEAISGLQAELGALKNGNIGNGDAISNGAIGQTVEGSGEITGASKKRSAASPKTPARDNE